MVKHKGKKGQGLKFNWNTGLSWSPINRRNQTRRNQTRRSRMQQRQNIPRPTLAPLPETAFGLPPPQPEGQQYFHDPGAEINHYDLSPQRHNHVRKDNPKNPYKTTKKELHKSQFRARTRGYRPRLFTPAEEMQGLKHTSLEKFMINNYKTRSNIRPAVIKRATKQWLKKTQRTPKTITRRHSLRLPTKTKRKTKKLKTV